MATIETVTIRGDEISIDLLIWRRFRRPMPGLFERILDLNRDIAESGPFLPVGSTVQIPIDAPKRAPFEVPAVRLYD